MLFRCAAIGICSAAAAVLIKQQNPALSYILTSLAVVMVLLGCRAYFEGARDVIKAALDTFGGDSFLVQPIMKCLAIALISKFSAALCKDSAQTSLSYAMETAGTFCAAAIAAPFIISLLQTINNIL